MNTSESVCGDFHLYQNIKKLHGDSLSRLVFSESKLYRYQNMYFNVFKNSVMYYPPEQITLVFVSIKRYVILFIFLIFLTSLGTA